MYVFTKQNQMLSCKFFGLYNFEVIFEGNFGYKWCKRSPSEMIVLLWEANTVILDRKSDILNLPQPAWSTKPHLSNGTAWIVNFLCQHTLYNTILRIARNLLETRENIKIESHSFYHIICDKFSWRSSKKNPKSNFDVFSSFQQIPCYA